MTSVESLTEGPCGIICDVFHQVGLDGSKASMGSEFFERSAIEKLEKFTLVVSTKEYKLTLFIFRCTSQSFEHPSAVRPPIHIVTEEHQRLTAYTG